MVRAVILGVAVIIKSGFVVVECVTSLVFSV